MRSSILRGLSLITPLATCLSIAQAAPAQAGDPFKHPVGMKVTVLAIPEATWLADLAPLPQDHATLLEKAKKLIREQNLPPPTEVICELLPDVESTFTSGQTLIVPTGWHEPLDPTILEPAVTTSKVIGTEVKVRPRIASFHTPIKEMDLTLTYMPARPDRHLVVFGAAATSEEERNKLSVPLPIFDQWEWTGKVSASGHPSLIASVRHHRPVEAGKEGDARTSLRYLAFVELTPQAEAKTPPPSPVTRTIRQKIYRIPLLDGALLFTSADSKTDDASLIQQLETWRSLGKANLLSDLSTSLAAGGFATIAEGKTFALQNELGQDFGREWDRLLLTPVSSDPSLVGTLLGLNTSQPSREDERKLVELSPGLVTWHTTYAERDPLKVPWPVSWLYNKSVHGWIDWYDTFVEDFNAIQRLDLHAPSIIGAVPSAPHAWGIGPASAASPPPSHMDVIVAEPASSTDEKAGDIAPQQQSHRAVFTGILIPSAQAVALLQQHQPEKDVGLLATLLAQAASGKAQLRFCTVASHQSSRWRIDSGRRHSYPAEMPSVPSAWNDHLVGTSMRLGHTEYGNELDLEHHIAPPRRQVWQMGIGEPHLQMWQSAFRYLTLSSWPDLMPGTTRMLAMVKVPSAITGAGLADADQSLLIFARQSGNPAEHQRPIDPFSSSDDDTKAPRRPIHTQLHVFEVPADELDQWQFIQLAEDEVRQGTFTVNDSKGLQEMLTRATDGTARLVGHAMVVTYTTSRAVISLIEEVRTGTEFHDAKNAPHRLRPTGLDHLPTGTSLKIDPSAGHLHGTKIPIISSSYEIAHASALPQEPDLATFIKSLEDGTHRNVARAKEFKATWHGNIAVKPGEPRCLGAVPDPAAIAADGNPTKILVAFLTATLEE